MHSENDSFDVIVIGAGPGGYVAAGRAAQLGLRTAVIERAELGGICLNWGCIPTKALLHGAEVARTLRTSAQVGVAVGEIDIDYSALVAHSRQTSQTLTSGIAGLMNARGATVLAGTATVTGKGQVDVEMENETRHLRATHVVIATGASPRSLPGIEPDGDRIWTYRDALATAEIPSSLVVVGSGAIGSEFASLFADMGSDVTLLEAADNFLPAEETAASSQVQKAFEAKGIDVRTGVTVNGVNAHADGVDVEVDGETITAERVLLAVGVQPNSAGLGLEEFDVCDERGFIRTDAFGKTEVWGLYAIGDVAGGPMLAHKASHEALVCINALAGFDRTPPAKDWRAWVPRCTYTYPEVASIGLSAQQATEQGYSPVARPIRFAENGRALGTTETDGFAQVLVDEASGEILGGSIVGHDATELISLLSVAHATGADAEEFTHAIIPHPSLAESVHESVLSALGRPVNSM